MKSEPSIYQERLARLHRERMRVHRIIFRALTCGCLFVIAGVAWLAFHPETVGRFIGRIAIGFDAL